MIRSASLLLIVLFGSFAHAADGLWRVTALDAETIILQGDYSATERAAFGLTPFERALGSWKYDRAFRSAADRAVAHREATEAKLAAGPYAATGAEIADFDFWKYPVGLSRFPDNQGRLKASDAPALLYIIYLRLRAPLQPGASIDWCLPTGETVKWTYDPEHIPTPLIKVNQVGYAPQQGRKFAYLGFWLGPKFGPYHPRENLNFELINETTGKVVKRGSLVFRVPDREKDGTSFIGEDVREMDFSDVTTPGRYFLRVSGVGRSLSFPIDDKALAAAFATHMKGLFHQRCGCAKTADLTAWTDDPCHLEVVRGVHPPEESKKIKHFAVIGAAMPSCTETLHLPGGWHDAADYDRRPQHLRVVNDLATLYLLRPESFFDGQLAVPEGQNGIPDILDEADWGLRHLLAAQQTDGGVGTWIETTRHPNPNDFAVASKDPLRYALSRATRNSSRAYAAHAALLARALRRAGTPEALARAETYQASAIAAWRYSCRPAPPPIELRTGKGTESVTYAEEAELNVHETVKGAVNLYALTQEADWLKSLQDIQKPFVSAVNKKWWSNSAARHAEFVFTEIDDAAYRQLRDFWCKKVLSEANRMITEEEGPKSYAYRLPWYPFDDWRVNTMGWGNCHPLRRANVLCLAHALTGERKYLDAAYLANDFHNGCNPNGTTWTSGLGVVYPVRFLHLPSFADKLAEYVPGITPYRNTYGLPPKAKEIWQKGISVSPAWPYWRRYANVEELTVAVSEFTVWETISPAAFTTGYLLSPINHDPPPTNHPPPATNLQDLPGYWTLP